MMPELPDDLWRSIYEGREDAWQEVVRRLEEPLAVAAHAILQNWDDAQDIVQSSYVKFLEQIQLKSAGGEFFDRPERYLWRIVRNSACDRFRQRRREAKAAKGAVENRACSGSDERHKAGYLDARSVIAEIVARLSLELRDVYRLRFVEEKSQCQAAEILRCDPKTVRKRERKFRGQVYCRLKELGLD